MDNKPLYIFLHMPKCAGSTFREHIEQNLDKTERLGFYNTEQKKLSRQDVYSIVESLSKIQKQKLKIIYGHEVYYGLHEYFDRPVRYVVFLRNIYDRTLSFFNYQFQKRGNQIFDGIGDSSFSSWLRSKKWLHDEMLGYLFDYGFIQTATKKETMDFESILNQFWFVGLTEDADENFLYLYQKLGINKFVKNQNISLKKMSSLTQEEKALVLLYSSNDDKLYEKAVIKNKRFIASHDSYKIIIMYMKQKRKILTILRKLKGYRLTAA